MATSWIGTGGGDPGDVATGGNVGIGTTVVSAAKLVLDGSGDAIKTNSSASAYSMITSTISGSSAVDLNNAAGALAVHTGGAERLRVDTGGKVGIGTGTPAAGLDVRKAVTGASGSAKGVNFEQALTAGANGDKLSGLYIKPSFSAGGHTGVETYAVTIETADDAIRLYKDASNFVLMDFGSIHYAVNETVIIDNASNQLRLGGAGVTLTLASTAITASTDLIST